MTATPRFDRPDIDLVRRAFLALRGQTVPLIALAVIARTVSSSLLAPMFSAIVTAIVARHGHYSIGNEDILAFCLSPAGVALILVAGTLLVFAQTAEVAGVLFLGRDAFEGLSGSTIRACLQTARVLPNLLILAFRQWVAYLLLLAPFLAVLGLVYWALWSKADLNYLVNARPPIFWIGAGIAGVLAAVYVAIAVSLFLRWIFSVPILLFEGKTGSAALRASSEMAQGHRWRLARLAVLWLLGDLASNAIALWVLKGFSRVVLASVGDSLHTVIPTAGALLALHAVTIAGISFAANAIGSFVVLQLYHGPAEATDAPAMRSPSRLALFAIVAGVAVAAVVTSLEVVASLEVVDDVEITGHRGDPSEAPENSIAAFLKAIDAGAEYGELDVQLTSDGQVVVAHDQDLMRQFGDPRRIRNTTLADLQKLDLGATFSASNQFRGERIATLESLLEAVGDRMRVMIELKIYPGDDVPALVARTLDVIARAKVEKTCIVISLSASALAEVRKRNPLLRTGYLVAESVGNLARLDIDILSVRSPLARPSLIAGANYRHKPVHAWTVDNPVEMVRLWDLGVANVITNNPRLMVARRAEVRALSDAERLLLRVRYLLTD